MKIHLLFLAFALLSLPATAAPHRVAIVTGAEPTDLEQYAAAELSRLLQSLFQVESEITPDPPPGQEKTILLGNPETNPSIPKSDWPEALSDQGQVLKSTDKGLILGGGSPVATLWSVYEFGHSGGMRYLLHGDFPPVDAPEFSLQNFDTVLEPRISDRAWLTIGSGAAGQESWGLAEHRILLTQLAKLKFNRVILVTTESQPYRSFDESADGQLWNGEEFPVSGETAGRSVFDGAATFENPDFAGTSTAEERRAAATRLVKGIFDTAEERGIRAEMRNLSSLDPDLTLLPLSQPSGGILPQFSLSTLPDQLKAAQAGKGFALQSWIPGDLNPSVYFLSRASFGSGITPAESLESLVTPICGEGVAERLATGFAAIESVDELLKKEDPDFAVPDPMMFMEHYQSGKPVPEWFARAKEFYGTAVNEMYRANTRARDGARPYILYHAKRFTFALHYMTAIEHAGLAGIAREEGNEEAWVENLELSVEAMHNALGIYAEVARDNSDRGVIAILNKYAYRPLLQALDEAPIP